MRPERGPVGTLPGKVKDIPRSGERYRNKVVLIFTENLSPRLDSVHRNEGRITDTFQLIA